MTDLTPHFSLEELTATGTGLQNDPPIEVAGTLLRLAELLEQIREMLGDHPIRVNSGYRSERVNRAVGGARNSAHTEGRAADIVPFSPVGVHGAFEVIRRSFLPWDKVIFENRVGTNTYWIHVQVARQGEKPRREAYIAQVTDTGTAYRRVP